MFADVFGLTISQGARGNNFNRAQAAFHAKKALILARLRTAAAVASDETGVRIEGVNAQHWVFCAPGVVLHEAAFSRAAQVVRDIAYALEVSDDPAPLRLKLWMGEVFALWGGLDSFATSTIARKRRSLEDRIGEILCARSGCDVTSALLRKIANARDQLLIFLDAPDLVQPTNNDCERALRPAVINRKVTNGFRSTWAAHADAAMRTVIDTERLTGLSPYHAIRNTIAA